MLSMSCVCHVFVSVHCCLVVTCWERADLFALFVKFNCIFVTFPCGILDLVWYLIVSIPDLCRFTYIQNKVVLCFKCLQYLDTLVNCFTCTTNKDINN